MFDQTEVETGHWADEIRRGDVVLFRFPIRHAGECESPKVRPCLVLEVEEWVGGIRLTLAYGTSVPDSSNPTVIVIDTTPYPDKEEGGHWWDVAVPEVSERDEVREAYKRYADMTAKQVIN